MALWYHKIPKNKKHRCIIGVSGLRSVYKPHSVRWQSHLDGHLSVQPTQDSGETGRLPPRRSAVRLCLALLPTGVAGPQTLLPAPVVSYTTFSPLPHQAAVLFCGPIRQVSPPRAFPGAVPCGVRTFLIPLSGTRPSDRPESRLS